MKKRIFTLFLTAVLCIFPAVSGAADGINISAEINNTVSYFTKNTTEIKEWDEILSFACVNAIQGSTLPERELSADDPVKIAEFLMERMALDIDLKQDGDSEDYVELLSSTQQTDGAFYKDDLYSDVLCYIALEGAQTSANAGRDEENLTVVYSAKNAVTHILSNQNGNGAITEDIKTHCLCMIYLSAFCENNAKVQTSVDDAAEYIKVTENNADYAESRTTEEICFAIMALIDCGKATTVDSFADYGNLPSELLYRKNEDYAYRSTKAAGEYDKTSTLAALKAYDTVTDGKSIYKSIMNYGAVNENMWSKLKWVAIGGGALALLSVVFWIWILFGKRRVRTSNDEEL